MSLLIAAEILGQFIVIKLFTNFDNEITLCRTVSRPLLYNETLLNIIESEFLARKFAVETFSEFLLPNEWSVRVPPFTARLLINYFGDVYRIEAAWSIFTE